ncbi:MAG: 50S ribosomal protein L4 [Candidatus Melainabacteria bacterium]|nr:50S ribosomal protein L4 [Candidatus Melainabacteria bacterium]
MVQKTKQSSSGNKQGPNLPEIFSDQKLKPNVHLLHLAVLRQLSNQRRGTACAKTRAEVRGGGAKPWTQKGTGRARVGSIRSPLWEGGGVSHGPKPRSYKLKLPKKARNLAIAQAIVAKQEQIIISKKLPEAQNGKTKNFVSAISSLGLNERPLLVVCSKGEDHYKEVERASRNIPYIDLKDWEQVGVFDLMKANCILITDSALKSLADKTMNLLKGKVA